VGSRRIARLYEAWCRVIGTSSLFILPVALALDRFLGEPPWLWGRIMHPVALIGRAIDRLDAALNDSAQSFRSRQLRGAMAILVLVLFGAASGLLVEIALNALPFLFSLAIEASLAAILLAHKSLIDHVTAVQHGLESNGLPGGREAVARIVGRDVSALDESGVARAAIESAAENFSDGLVAPVFWYALFGLPSLLIFKIVSTADSMIGHRSSRYEAFGWAAARLDDILSFVPARLAALLIVAAATITKRNGRQAARIAWRDARVHKSPNAGWPEAAAAGALGLALGGPRRYGDREIDGAWLNPERSRDAAAADIGGAARLIDAAWAILFCIAALTAVTALWIAR
jgi:adenosylcobinamide-phosphate synthase